MCKSIYSYYLFLYCILQVSFLFFHRSWYLCIFLYIFNIETVYFYIFYLIFDTHRKTLRFYKQYQIFTSIMYNDRQNTVYEHKNSNLSSLLTFLVLYNITYA